MTTFADKIFCSIVAGLVHLVYHPKVYYENVAVQENLLKEPSILVSNHRCHTDGAIVATALRGNIIRNLAAKDRFENKFSAFYLKHTGCIPIDRRNLDTQWVHRSIDILTREKQNIGIYPEGIRNLENKDILPFHSGVTTIAALTGAPIVMVYIDGPYNFIHRTRLYVGTPFHLNRPTEGLTAEYIRQETQNLHDRMVSMQQDFFRKTGQNGNK